MGSTLVNGDRANPPLRLWPGVAVVAVQWVLRYGLPAVMPEAGGIALIGGVAGGLAVLVWWLFFSRAPLAERIGAILLMALALVAAPRILDKSITTGMMGMMFPMFAIPVLSLVLVAWAAAGRRLAGPMRLGSLAAAIAVACGGFALLRTDGISADARAQLAWRWSKTSEQVLLARTEAEVRAPGAEPAPGAAGAPPESAAGAEWPGFRGPHRDSVVRGARIQTDWSSSPPVELWRRPVGPGWSSFAVSNGRIYTQEQRGEFEVVVCYDMATGKPVWEHRDPARFWESNAGPGPRGTPTVHGGRIYAFGATGILNALDAATGAKVWTRNVASDTGAKLPGWGFSSSPLIHESAVIVAAASRLASYDLLSGERRWAVPAGGSSYGSPHLLTLGGVPQVLLLSGNGATSVAPADGKILWKHEWKDDGSAILQPALTADGGVLITNGNMMGGAGTRRLAVTAGPGGWKAEERWTSTGLKPYFNDLVIHNGHAFGFDGSILSCIDLADGRRKWKGGRYGHGQLLLLPEQDLLVVLSEEGELALVQADAAQFREMARFRVLDGKTWNHPVLAGDVLLVRNGEQMAAFRLARRTS